MYLKITTAELAEMKLAEINNNKAQWKIIHYACSGFDTQSHITAISIYSFAEDKCKTFSLRKAANKLKYQDVKKNGKLNWDYNRVTKDNRDELEAEMLIDFIEYMYQHKDSNIMCWHMPAGIKNHYGYGLGPLLTRMEVCLNRAIDTSLEQEKKKLAVVESSSKKEDVAKSTKQKETSEIIGNPTTKQEKVKNNLEQEGAQNQYIEEKLILKSGQYQDAKKHLSAVEENIKLADRVDLFDLIKVIYGEECLKVDAAKDYKHNYQNLAKLNDVSLENILSGREEAGAGTFEQAKWYDLEKSTQAKAELCKIFFEKAATEVLITKTSKIKQQMLKIQRWWYHNHNMVWVKVLIFIAGVAGTTEVTKAWDILVAFIKNII